MYVDLKVVSDPASLPDSCLNIADEMVYVVDAKSFFNRPCASNKALASPLPLPFLRHILEWLFGDRTKEDRPGVFKEGDVLLFFDGRSTTNAANFAKLIQKLFKGNPKLRQRCQTTVRLFYHNREFSDDGAKAPKFRRVHFHSGLPEPLENLKVVLHKDTQLPRRGRRFLDLPGDTSSRGVANLAIRTPEEIALSSLSIEAAESILASGKGTLGQKADDGQNASEADGFEFECELSAGEQDPLKGEEKSDGETRVLQPLCCLPWEGPEVQFREWLNLFAVGPKGGKKAVLDVSVGTGVAAVAACREQHRYLGLVSCETHRAVVRDSIRLHIVMDLILNRRDGFQLARFLSRARSLGAGESDPAAAVVAVPGNADTAKQGAEPDDKVAAAAAQSAAVKAKSTAVAASGSSSSSSSSDGE
jgi:hypothetical protein